MRLEHDRPFIVLARFAHGPTPGRFQMGSVAPEARPETKLRAEVRTAGGICAKGRFHDEAAGTAEAADATSHRQVFAGGNVVTFGSQRSTVVQDEVLRIEGGGC